MTGASGSVIGKIEVRGLSSMGKEELLYLLDMAPEKPLDAEQVRAGIKRAFLKGIFEDIAVETAGGEEMKVIVRVKEKTAIEKISVEGDYAVSGRQIKNAFR